MTKRLIMAGCVGILSLAVATGVTIANQRLNRSLARPAQIELRRPDGSLESLWLDDYLSAAHIPPATAQLVQKKYGNVLTANVARSLTASLPRRSMLRWQLQQLTFASLLTLKVDRRTLLELFVNRVYMGTRGDRPIYGLPNASKIYFHERLRELNDAQRSLLIDMIANPSRPTQQAREPE